MVRRVSRERVAQVGYGRPRYDALMARMVKRGILEVALTALLLGAAKRSFAVRFRPPEKSYGNSGGGMRFFVACSNAYASSISFGSLHAVPVKLTLNGCGLGSKPAGNAVGP